MSTARRESVPIYALKFSIRNKRVIGGLMSDGTIAWRFKRLMPDRSIRYEQIRLSHEAVLAMHYLMLRLDEWAYEHKVKAK